MVRPEPAQSEPEQLDEFPKAYEPGGPEGRWYPVWEESGAFRPEARPDGEPFCIVIPPPNVTGSLHMGHAFEHSLIDATIRRKRMQGRAALWLPGTDHAGIATQNVVERELAKEGVDRHELGREAFVERVWEWKERSGGQITRQMRRMGASCDWTRERFTMDEGLSRAVREVFVQLFEEGLVYRANRIINWCPRCHTALSDIEVEHEDVAGELVRIRYPLTDGSGWVTVATTRAETMLGDTAVAVHPDDERYATLVGATLTLPLVGRGIPVVADAAVDPGFGTGAVKVTPAHDPNDFEIAQRHGLEAIDIFTVDAQVNEEGGRFAGMDRFEARRAVKDALADEGLIESVDEHLHAVGHCYRCRSVVEPRLSLQWFVRVAPLAAPALDAVREDRTVFAPERWEKLYVDWLENLRDWCISRQIWWGHRIPAWYCECGAEIVASTQPATCTTCGSGALTQDEDVLDTWFSSALWPFTTLGWPDDTDDLRRFYPNAMLHTGFDIIYFWVARMMQMGLHFAGDVPFREVAIHGLVRDADGRKMSKSFGNVVDPLELADRYGADALRFALTRAASPGQDVPLAEEWVQGARNFVNKLWNASRFAWMSFDGATLAQLEEAGIPPVGSLSLPDRWILSRLGQVIGAVDEGFERYDFADGVRELQAFTWSELCDWYIELSKQALLGGDAARRADTCRVLGVALGTVLRLLHPVVPFVTEELWSRLGGGSLLALERWPTAGSFAPDREADAAMSSVVEIVSSVRRFRSEHSIAPSLRFGVWVVPADAEQASALRALEREVLALARLDTFELVESRPARQGEQRLVAAGAEIVIPFEGLVDVAAVREQLDKRLAKLRSEVEKSRSKLSDEGFLAKAPPPVVEAMRRREAEALDAIEVLATQRAQLGS